MDKKRPAIETATFAGGCFWCTESDYEQLRGVTKVVAGYTGGHKVNPTYEEVCSGHTGHVEAVQVHFAPELIRYEQLLDIFWRHIDPTDQGGQFVDRGAQYRAAIFYHDVVQKALAELSKRQLQQSGRFNKPVVTEILPFEAFYAAESHHQDYYKKNPLRYKFYRRNSGRDQYLRSMWKDDETLAELLRLRDNPKDAASQ